MASFEQFLSTFSTNPNKKGEQFEYFVKEFLKNDLYNWKSKVKTVWPFKDAPINWGPDRGTDLIFEDFEGRYWAVQAKNYASKHSVTKEDVDSFLSDSNRSIIHKRLLIISTNNIAKSGLKTINDQEKEVIVFRFQDFEDRGDIYPDNLADFIKFKNPEIPTPKPHQTEAKEDVVQKFKKCSKGQLIMACGTGKTYTFFWIHKDLKSKKTLVLVPSLNLLSQTLEEWIKANGSSFTSLCICSDPSAAKNVQEDEVVLDQSDIPYSVTWDVKEIVSFLKRPEPTVIFSTYQSSDLIAKAQKKVPDHMFDLSIADEAHRCTGKANSEFTTILDDKKIRSHKKLFGTATPKLYATYIKKAAQDKEIEIIDMNDEEKFGVVLHNLSFGKAIKKKLLADYQVIVVGVNDSRVKEMIDQREFISIKENHKSDAASLGAQLGFIKAIKDYNLSRLVTFHGRVKKASDFSKSLPEIYEWTKSEYKGNKELDIDYVSGQMQTSERRRKLNELKNIKSNQIGILSNARCLGEGVDVPNMDGIAFINPKSSEIDIVQSIGRAIRKPDSNKSVGYIILPVFIEEKDSIEQSIESSNFEPVWKVMNALKSHDEDFKIELDNLRMNLGKTGVTGRTPKFVFDLPTKINSTFQDKIETHLIEKVSDSWYFFFGLIQNYISKKGTSRVPKQLKLKGYNLGDWVDRQRYNYKKNSLSDERVKKLESLIEWSWDPLNDDWDKNFNLLLSYYKKYNSSRISKEKSYKNVRLGSWCSVQRLNYKAGKLEQQKVRRLKKSFNDWSWDPLRDEWNEKFQLLKEYFKEFRTSRIKIDVIYKNEKIGAWVSEQRHQYKRKKIPLLRIKKIESEFKDWSWDIKEDKWFENFEITKSFYNKNHDKTIGVKKKFNGLNVKTWVVKQREYYKSQKLNKEKIICLESIPGWSWNPVDEVWMQNFKLLKLYYSSNDQSKSSQSLIFKGVNLGRWVSKQRIKYKKNILSEKQISYLESLNGWQWSRNYIDVWEENFINLKNNYNKTKSLKKLDPKFRQWILFQRQKYKNKKLTKKQIEKLERLSFWTWDPFSSSWNGFFKALVDYYKKFNTVNIPEKTIFNGKKIGEWIRKQRQKKVKGSLSNDRIKQLEKTFDDWTWSAKETLWFKKFQVLKDYQDQYKTISGSKAKSFNGVNLISWINTQKRAYRDKKISDKRIRLIEQNFIDWKWH